MKITKVLSGIILESARFKVLYDKMVLPKKGEEGDTKKPKGLMDFVTLKQIIFADPKTKAPEGFDIEGASVVDMEKVYIGGHINWLLKNFLKPVISTDVEPNTAEYKRLVKAHESVFLEDLEKTKRDLRKYDKFKHTFPQEKRDINKLTSKELFDLVKDLKLDKTKGTKQDKEEAVKTYEYPGGKVDFKSSKWTVIKISDTGELGKNAACFYGGYQEHDEGESNWCTSAPGLNYFKNYIKDGPLYVILPNESGGKIGTKTKLPTERYQFHFPSSQFMDRDDRQVSLTEKLNGDMKELREYFKFEFAKNLGSKTGDVVSVEYPRSSEAKFIAIYGFDELFNTMSPSLINFSFKNNSNEKLALDIPERIGQFKNLETLRLINCLKSLPESIGELTKLDLLNVSENPELKSLPEKAISKLTSLSFLNIKKTPNLKLSNEFYEKLGNEFSDGLYYTDF